MNFSVDGESARNTHDGTLLPSSALQPCKHLVSCVGLLRSRPDPFNRSKIEQDKASTSGKRPACFCLTRSFKPAMKSICVRRRTSAPARLRLRLANLIYKSGDLARIRLSAFLAFAALLQSYLNYLFLFLPGQRKQA